MRAQVLSLIRPSLVKLFYATLTLVAVCLSSGKLQAQTSYTARSGKIEFSVGSNIPLVKVKGSSSAVTGGGEATVAEDAATIRNLHFEVDPLSFKTGMGLRDEHLYERVFTAADGSRPKIVLRADRFLARLDRKTSRWEGTLEAQLTMRGVTKPVLFHATAERSGEKAIVTADGVVKISEFGVKPIGYSGAAVHDDVSVTVSNLMVGR